MPITRRRAERALAACLIACAGLPAAALTLELPDGARPTAEDRAAPDSHFVPAGPWRAEAGVPGRRVEGAVTRRAWRVAGPARTTLQVIAPLREQLREQGFEIVFSCRDRACGGFDFRFAVEVLPAPAMYVDLTRYRFLSAVRVQADGATEHLTLLASRSEGAGYLQAIHVAQGGAAPLAVSGAAPLAPHPEPAEAPALPVALERRGHAALPGLDFASGAAELAGQDHPALAALAAYLRDRPGRRVVLVGHTDAVGALEGNIALSRARAEAVMRRLTGRHGVDPGQLSAEGVGFLAPVASNLTEEGREANRRVEAVLLARE